MINKRERKYLQYMVLANWRIEVNSRGKALLDGDSTLPVSFGPMAQSLIKRGYLQTIAQSHGWLSVHHTMKAEKLRCHAPMCHRGEVFDEDSNVIGKCVACEGTGLTLGEPD